MKFAPASSLPLRVSRYGLITNWPDGLWQSEDGTRILITHSMSERICFYIYKDGDWIRCANNATTEGLFKLISTNPTITIEP